MLIRLGPDVAFAQTGVIDSGGWTGRGALRFSGAPEMRRPRCAVTPALVVGTRGFRAEVSREPRPLVPGANSLLGVTATG
jgi:hypothetical protein